MRIASSYSSLTAAILVVSVLADYYFENIATMKVYCLSESLCSCPCLNQVSYDIPLPIFQCKKQKYIIVINMYFMYTYNTKEGEQ